MDEQARIRLLATCPLFAGVPTETLGRLAGAVTVRRYRRGQLLFAEGDAGDTLMIVAAGSLKAFSATPDGEELLLAVLGEHDAVGELTVADGGTRSASVSALTDATVLRVPRDAVLALAETSPPVTRALLESLARVVRRLTDASADLVFLDIPRRAAKLLLSLEPDGSGVVRTPLTQAELATRIGASRQSLNAALQEFQRRGWIRIGTRRMQIRDAGALRRFVGS